MLRIACLGLFDTVGALGVPVQGLRRLNREKFEFHDVELSPLVDLALHALAIDEHRRPFEASLWRRNKFMRTSAKVEQVWFPGVHADIGGGYFNDEERDKADPRPLDDLALDWMIKRLHRHVSDFPVADQIWASPPEGSDLDPEHNSLTWKYKFWRTAIRSIDNRKLPPALVGNREVVVGHDPHTKALNESIHIRALRRLGTQARIDTRTAVYSPVNVVSCLPDLQWLYSDEAPSTIPVDTLTVTAMDGAAVLPRSPPAATVLAEVVAAAERLQRAQPGLLDKIGWSPP
jgi:hypothetical protein